MDIRTGRVITTIRNPQRMRGRKRRNVRLLRITTVLNVLCVRPFRLLAFCRGRLICRHFLKPHLLLRLPFAQTLNWVSVCRCKPVLRHWRKLMLARPGLFECLRDSASRLSVCCSFRSFDTSFSVQTEKELNESERVPRSQAIEFFHAPPSACCGLSLLSA